MGAGKIIHKFILLNELIYIKDIVKYIYNLYIMYEQYWNHILYNVYYSMPPH